LRAPRVLPRRRLRRLAHHAVGGALPPQRRAAAPHRPRVRAALLRAEAREQPHARVLDAAPTRHPGDAGRPPRARRDPRGTRRHETPARTGARSDRAYGTQLFLAAAKAIQVDTTAS